MSEWDPQWEARAADAMVDANTRRRRAGRRFTDEETFQAVVRAAISGNTKATTIERISSELAVPFLQFDMSAFADRPLAEVETSVNQWFLGRKAGSTGLRRTIRGIHGAAAILAQYSCGRDGAEGYFADCIADCLGVVEDAAVALGTSPKWKLPGFGVALSAELLKLLGHDICKPDRHVLRCVGAWWLVAFRRWPARGEFTPPTASVAELRATMLAVRDLASAANTTVNEENSVIWLAGALSGARLTTAQFEELTT
ncbi:hypothetical protein ACM61V_16635 [Sphingomonas sp. TX0543]|uniref:hypothetical protein n=1 Tax=Sphingomonas sp. TX0543 TaxID=3399682 RepID=UPI003AFB7DC9